MKKFDKIFCKILQLKPFKIWKKGNTSEIFSFMFFNNGTAFLTHVFHSCYFNLSKNRLKIIYYFLLFFY